MKNDTLHNKFIKAVDYVNNYTDPLPADFLLKLYAYYKIANKNFDNPKSKKPLISAFKANALFQARNVTEKQAKQLYVELVESYFKISL